VTVKHVDKIDQMVGYVSKKSIKARCQVLFTDFGQGLIQLLSCSKCIILQSYCYKLRPFIILSVNGNRYIWTVIVSHQHCNDVVVCMRMLLKVAHCSININLESGKKKHCLNVRK
jgi:hypothetical protein